MKCQYRFINYNKYTTLGEGNDNEADNTCVRAGGIWETSAPSTECSCEWKIALKTKVDLKRKSPYHS